MIPTLVIADTPIEAWKKVVAQLHDEGDKFNVVVHVSAPLEYTANELRVYDPRKKLAGARSVEDVANTIFPKKSKYWAATSAVFVAHYKNAYSTLLANGPRSWGMYFLRLVDFGAKHTNQLEKTVAGLSSWGHNHKAAFTVHLSSSETDAPRPLGAPCLQYCQFLREGDCLSLLAVYRSHDYFLKALGNFIGLSRFLQYVAEQSGLKVGSIVCHSTYAYLQGNRRRAFDLIR